MGDTRPGSAQLPMLTLRATKVSVSLLMCLMSCKDNNLSCSNYTIADSVEITFVPGGADESGDERDRDRDDRGAGRAAALAARHERSSEGPRRRPGPRRGVSRSQVWRTRAILKKAFRFFFGRAYTARDASRACAGSRGRAPRL